MFTLFLYVKDYLKYGKQEIVMHINNNITMTIITDKGARTTKGYSSSTSSSVSQLGIE